MVLLLVEVRDVINANNHKDYNISSAGLTKTKVLTALKEHARTKDFSVIPGHAEWNGKSVDWEMTFTRRAVYNIFGHDETITAKEYLAKIYDITLDFFINVDLHEVHEVSIVKRLPRNAPFRGNFYVTNVRDVIHSYDSLGERITLIDNRWEIDFKRN